MAIPSSPLTRAPAKLSAASTSAISRKSPASCAGENSKNVPWRLRLETLSADAGWFGRCSPAACACLMIPAYWWVSPRGGVELDYKNGTLLDMFQISDCLNECVHGLEAAPSVDFPFSIESRAPVAAYA